MGELLGVGVACSCIAFWFGNLVGRRVEWRRDMVLESALVVTRHEPGSETFKVKWRDLVHECGQYRGWE